MYLLSDVLNSYRDAGLKASVSILFDKNEFSNKIYLFSSTSELNQPSFNKIYRSLIDKTIDGNTNKFLVKSISSWVTSSLNFSVRMTNKQLLIELGSAPSVVTNLFEKLPKELFNLTVEHTIIEISCITPNQHPLVDLLLNDAYLSTQKFQLIYETNRLYRVIDVLEPTKKLEEIKKQKSLMDELIRQKLNELNGSLSGIRHTYNKHNINYFLVCLLHGIKNIDEYEKTIKLDFFSKKTDSAESTHIRGNQKNKPKISDYEKPNQESLSSTEVIKETVNTAKSAVNRKVKEINNSVVYDKNKSEKNFLSKLSSIFKSPNKSKDIDTPVQPLKELTANDEGDLEVVQENSEVNSKINHSPVEECHFVKFNNKSDIGIEVQSLKSFDAFDFESINNKLIVVINSNHPFYSKLYRNASVESKRVIDMMISSLCHLSHLNISETVKQQDKKLFSRWSEYLEEYLLEE